jgi:hypothetical protein
MNDRIWMELGCANTASPLRHPLYTWENAATAHLPCWWCEFDSRHPLNGIKPCHPRWIARAGVGAATHLVRSVSRSRTSRCAARLVVEPVLVVCVGRTSRVDWLGLSADAALMVRPGDIAGDWPPKMPAEPAANCLKHPHGALPRRQGIAMALTTSSAWTNTTP